MSTDKAWKLVAIVQLHIKILKLAQKVGKIVSVEMISKKLATNDETVYTLFLMAERAVVTVDLENK